MRKFIAFVLVEAALLCTATYLSMLTTIAPIWIWPTASVVFLVLAALLYAAEIERWFSRKGPQRIEADTKFKAIESRLEKTQQFLCQMFGKRTEKQGGYEAPAPEMTVSVGKRRNKKLFVLLTLRRFLGKLVPW